nr:15686_t:CDS:2 [Entrophospora candida]
MESNTLKLKESLNEELPGRSKEIEKLLLWMGQTLWDTSTSLIPALMEISMMGDYNICVIFISQVPWDKFKKVLGLKDPTQLYFQNEDLKFFKQFLELIYNSLWTDCDLVDLLRLLPELYEKCLETINEEEAQIEDWDGLYNSLMPHMKSIFDKSHLLDISPKTGQSPKWVSYLLIAMFLASHIPQKHDIKLFAKESDPRKKRRNGRGSRSNKQQVDIKSEPPHASELERIFAIFYSIYDGMVINSFDLHQQIQLFVDCHMARRTTPFEQLDNPMYLCKVDFNSIKQICKNVDFNIAIYLDGMDM